MKKILCGIMAVLMVCAATGCSDKESASSTSGKQLVSDAGDNVNVAEEDMPYGSTVFELSENNDDHVKIITGFDKRYFGGDDEDNPDYSEIYKIHDYVSALNSNDHDLFKQIYYPEYLEYACTNHGYDNVDTYIDELYNTIVKYLGEGFEINYIDVSNCLDDTNTGAKDYMQTVDGYLDGIGALDKVTSRKVIEIGGYTAYKTESGIYQLTNHMESIILGVYEIDGQAYIV